MKRGFAVVAWLGVVFTAGLHVAFWRGLALSPAALAGLLVAFFTAAAVLLGVILAVQRAAADPRVGVAGAYFAVVPRWSKWVLGLGFVYVALQLVDWLPVGGSGRGGVDPATFERAFTAILAWQMLAAAFYHTFAPEAPKEAA